MGTGIFFLGKNLGNRWPAEMDFIAAGCCPQCCSTEVGNRSLGWSHGDRLGVPIG